MASAFSHIAVPVALRMVKGSKTIPWKLLALALFFSAAPDLDTIGFKFGIAYESQWGHRGFTHSIVFAVVLALTCVPFATWMKTSRAAVFWTAFLSMVSHGVLDAFTNGGLGVAFLWPMNSDRYFFPWQVVEVSPISVARFFSERGLIVIRSELFYIWLPCLAVGLVGLFVRRSRRRNTHQKNN